MSPGSHCWRVLAPAGLCPPRGQGHSPHRPGQSVPPLRAGRRQRLPGRQHRQRCSLLSPTFPGESPKPPCLARTESYGGERRGRTPDRANPRRAPPGRPRSRVARVPEAPGRPVTFRTARPLARPLPEPFGGSRRRRSARQPRASASPRRPPRARAPRPRQSARLVPAERAGEEAPPSSHGPGTRAAEEGPRVRTVRGEVRAQRGSGVGGAGAKPRTRSGAYRGGVEDGVDRALHGLGPPGRASGRVQRTLTGCLRCLTGPRRLPGFARLISPGSCRCRALC